MNRRQFLLFSAAALSAVRGAAATAPALTLPLWPDQPPGRRAGGEARLSARGALGHIPRPVLTVWQPARATGHGVLVAAGGGYQRIEMGSEALACGALADGARLYRRCPELPLRRGGLAGRCAGAAAGCAAGPAADPRPGIAGQRARFFGGGHLLGMPPVGRRLPATRRRMRWTTSPPPPTAPR